MKKLTEFIEKRFDFLETIFALIFSIGFFMVVKAYELGLYVFYTGSAGIIIVYYFMAMQERKDEIDTGFYYLGKIAWLSYIISILNITGSINISEKLFLTSAVTTIILFIVLGFQIYFKFFKKVKEQRPGMVRSIIYLLISLFVTSLTY